MITPRASSRMRKEKRPVSIASMVKRDGFPNMQTFEVTVA